MRHSKGATKSCNMCSKNFCTMKQLQLHLKTAHPGYTCGKCSKLFQDQANLERHSAGTLKQCDICSQEFCTLGQVQLHKQSVHPNYKCKNCEKSFKDQAHLVRHQQANGMYKNKCDFCRQRFCTKLELMNHIKNHKKRLIELRNGVWKSWVICLLYISVSSIFNKLVKLFLPFFLTLIMEGSKASKHRLRNIKVLNHFYLQTF